MKLLNTILTETNRAGVPADLKLAMCWVKIILSWCDSYMSMSVVTEDTVQAKRDELKYQPEKVLQDCFAHMKDVGFIENVEEDVRFFKIMQNIFIAFCKELLDVE